MSTKTLRKRIALVAVSALGLGLMSVAPAQATNNFSSNITLSTTSLTVVGTGTTTNAGYFFADVTTADTTTATAPTQVGLQANESMTVFVSAFPTGKNAGDITFRAATLADTVDSTHYTPRGATEATLRIPNSNLAAAGFRSGNQAWSATAASNNALNRYWVSAIPGAAALDAGEYTVTVRLNNISSAGRAIVDRTFKIKFVSNIADAGAVLVATQTGNIISGADVPYLFTANSNTSVTLRDANGGRVVNGINSAGNVDPATMAPALNANIISSTGIVGEVLTPADTGVAGRDYVAATSTIVEPAESGNITRTVSEQLRNRANGTYGVVDTVGISTAASLTNTLRVRLTDASASSSVAITVVLANGTLNTASTVTLTAAGIAAADKLPRAVLTTPAASVGTIAYTVPATTTTLTVDIDTDGGTSDQSGRAYTSTTTWSGNFATANVTPATTTALTTYVGADGVVTRTLTNSSPVAGAVATISLAGYASGAAVTVTITWAAPAPASVLVLDPAPGIFAKTKASTVFTFGVFDQFGNAMAGQQVQPRVSGTTGNNPLGTTTYATVTTGATGTGTFTLTDALAANDGVDSVTFTTITGGIASAAYTVTYKTTLPVVGIMNEFYSETFGHSLETEVNIAVPATGIPAAKTLVLARDLSASLITPMFTHAGAATDDMVAIRVRALTATGAAAEGAPVTITAGTGGHVVGANGLPASTRTVAVSASGDATFRILATATGVITWTVTSGTMTDTIRMTVATAAAGTGRTVAISGATTGTANGAGIPMTVTVKDRYGNAVTGAVLSITASGVGAFMGGATSQSFTTDSSGTFTFLATSYTNAGGAATFTARVTNAVDATSAAGFVTTAAGNAPVAVDSTLAAGVASASAAVTFADGVNAAEANAQAATDAAAEATDAANAATDAANAAAEAADAATAAAQDAADAVAALSTQVTELVSALRKQITSLTNLVIKIQRKVRA
jgi:trimeric autotransporter adhesin